MGGSPACDPEATGRPADQPVCYAEAFAARCGFGPKPVDAAKFPIWGADVPRRYFGDKHWREPLKWNAAAKAAGEMARVFCMSMGDWAEGRPDQQPHVRRLQLLIHDTSWLYWLMLTKRPQLITKLMASPSARVWHGTTAENQHWLDIRWKHLREVNASVLWLSIEPMCGRIKLPAAFLARKRFAWVICGGGSGGAADAGFQVADARYLRDQCKEAGVPFHMKQMAGHTKAALEAIPPDLQIRAYPVGVRA